MSLEIGEGLVKAIESDSLKGKRRVTAVITKRLSSRDPAHISEEVNSVFGSLKPNPQAILLNIPRHLVTARFLKIPSVDDLEIDKILKIESLKHLPYTDEKAVYGYRVTEKTDDGYSRILLAVAQAGIISDLTAVIAAAKVVGVSSLSLSSEGLFLWYLMVRGSPVKENVLLINLDLDHIDIDIVEGDNLVFTRGVAFGLNDLRKLEKITLETNISINTYQKESAKKIDRIIITGGKNEIAAFRPAIIRETKLPVDTIEQFKDFPIDAGVMEAENDVSFAELLGSSMASNVVSINLISDDAREEARIMSSKSNLITAMILVAMLATLIFGIFIKKVYDNNVYFSAINSKIRKMEPGVSAAKKMIKDINVIRQVMAKKPLAIDIISEIYGITPDGVSLSMIDFESGKSLSARGSAPTLSDVFKYVTVLENSPYLESVKVKYANKRKADSGELADFEISALPTEIK